MRVVVVGGGILGTMHAWQAVRRGHEVVHLEREQEPRSASVRNFGLIWVSGRAPGAELTAALRSRELWEELSAEVHLAGFRPAGSLTVCRTEAELAVAEQVMERLDAADRGFRLLDHAAARRLNPVLRSRFRAALWCRLDAAVEPRRTLHAIRDRMAGTGLYTFLPGREVRDVRDRVVSDDRGDVHGADVVFLCTGAWHGGLVRELTTGPLGGLDGVRRVRLQMMETAPIGERLPTAVADADSFRYYPAYRGTALDALNRAQPQSAVAAAHAMQTLVVQRLDGGLTIGDTHEYAEPFGTDVLSAPYEHLAKVVESLLGRPMPPVVRRWAGVYSQCTDPDRLLHRASVADGVWLVTGPGGKGMTMAPAIAEQSLAYAGL